MLAVVACVVLAVQALRLAPEWVPTAAVLVGGGVIARFALGPEAGTVRTAAIAAVAVITPVVVAVTWGLRTQRGVVHVPGSVRPLLTSTPLGTACALELDAHHNQAPRS